MTVRQLYSWPAIPNKNTIARARPGHRHAGGQRQRPEADRDHPQRGDVEHQPAAAGDRGGRGARHQARLQPQPGHFGGMADFEATIKGLSAFCAGYPAAAASNAAAMKKYIEGHNVSGITTSGNTITFTLTKPAPWLVGAMTLRAVQRGADRGGERPARHPGRVQPHVLRRALPASSSYTPKKNIKFTRNPVWKASTDPLRKAYVNAINVDETGNQTTIYQQMPTGSASLGMTFDSLAPPANFPNMLNQIKSGSHNVNLGATYSSNPYLVFNTVSPNNGERPGQGGGAPGPLLRDRAQPAAEGPRRGRRPTRRSRTSCRPASTARRTCPPATTRTRTTRPRPSPCSRPRASPRATRCRSSSCTAATARAARRSSTTSPAS